MGTLADHPISDWRERYGLRAIVETGIGAGDGVMQAMREGYERIISIEASPDVAATAIQRIGNLCPSKLFSVMIGPSPQQLRILLRDLCGPVLFWLDAHIPKFYGHDIGEAFPLLSEVVELSRRECFDRDVVIADDMAMYGLDAEMAFPPEVCIDAAPSDVVRDAISILRRTHDVKVERGGYGYLVALPR